MFKNKSVQIKIVKDAPEAQPTLLDELNSMSPEELHNYSDDLMKKMIIRIGVVVVAKVAITIALNAAVKHYESK